MKKTLIVSTTVEIEISNEVKKEIVEMYNKLIESGSKIGDVFEFAALQAVQNKSIDIGPVTISEKLIKTKIIGTDVEEYI